jgi:hypothetical protein
LLAQLTDLKVGEVKVGEPNQLGAIRVPTSGLYRVTLTVRIVSKVALKDAALRIGTVDQKTADLEIIQQEGKGPQGQGANWLISTVFVELGEGATLSGDLSIDGDAEVKTDRGWFVIEKLTP